VKVSPTEKIASKFASADFQNFCQLVSKQSAETAVFFGLEGTLIKIPLSNSLITRNKTQLVKK